MLIAFIHPVCALLAPWPPGASTPSLSTVSLRGPLKKARMRVVSATVPLLVERQQQVENCDRYYSGYPTNSTAAAS